MIRIGNWVIAHGDLFRIVGWNYDVYNDRRVPVLANWSRPRLHWLKGLFFKLVGRA